MSTPNQTRYVRETCNPENNQELEQWAARINKALSENWQVVFETTHFGTHNSWVHDEKGTHGETFPHLIYIARLDPSTDGVRSVFFYHVHSLSQWDSLEEDINKMINLEWEIVFEDTHYWGWDDKNNVPLMVYIARLEHL